MKRIFILLLIGVVFNTLIIEEVNAQTVMDNIYEKFDNNYNYCRILIVYDLIYLYNKEKTDNIDQFNKIYSILSSLKKNDFIIFNSEFQRRKYLEFKDKYNFQVRKENTDIQF